MARETHRLNALKIKNLNLKGWYPDGLGLYLQVSNTGSKSWVFRYTRDGKAHWHGLGSFEGKNNLSAARESATRCRQMLRDGKDPITWKKALQHKEKADLARLVTFDACSEQYISAHQMKWKSTKHASQWRNTLETYASPYIGQVPIHDVDVTLVMRVLEPIWKEKTETANRVRSRIELVLDWATARQYRSGDNPARWRGHLDKLLPSPRSISPVKHHASLDYRQVPDFYGDLLKSDSLASSALRFIILTGVRSSEGRGARWEDISFKDSIWRIPGDRMKSGRPHNVPLVKATIELLEAVKGLDTTFVFPGLKAGTGLTEATLRKLLRTHHDSATIHGFRSTFRTWTEEQTSFPHGVAEAALAHVINDQTVAAYQRGDLFDKRKLLMSDWVDYCESTT